MVGFSNSLNVAVQTPREPQQQEQVTMESQGRSAQYFSCASRYFSCASRYFSCASRYFSCASRYLFCALLDRGPRFICASIALLATILTATAAHAQSSTEIRVQHIAPRPTALPEPGEPMKLTASLKGTRVGDMRMRLLAVIDGQLIDQTSNSSNYNDRDEPTYSFTIHTPLVELGYVFMLYDKKGEVIFSPQWYSVNRGCLPTISIAPDRIDPTLQGGEKLKALVQQAQDLERDIAKYQKVLKILEEIKAERS